MRTKNDLEVQAVAMIKTPGCIDASRQRGEVSCESCSEGRVCDGAEEPSRVVVVFFCCVVFLDIRIAVSDSV
eukprot:scaffold20686_cov42-Attheya_sp.AAC.3